MKYIYTLLFSKFIYFQDNFPRKKKKAMIILIVAQHNLMPPYKLNKNILRK